MSIVVFKFGGTSVNSAQKRDRIIELAKRERDAGNDVVCVVSAMGRSGDPYATDTLLSLLPTGADADKNVSDLLVGCGETISACVVADCFKKQGVKAYPMTSLQAGITTNGKFGDARVKTIDTAMMKAKMAEGNVLIVTGFQGYSEGKELTTLGRGGSDTSAIALGGALGASKVVIYSDVPGVAQTDPRVIPTAKFLKSIDFDSMLFLASMGAKVLHPNAIRTAIQFNMPFRAMDINNDVDNTVIGGEGEAAGGLFGMSIFKDNRVYAKEGETGDVCLEDESGKAVLLTDVDGKNKEVKAFPGHYFLVACCDNSGKMTPDKMTAILKDAGFAPAATYKKDGKIAWVLPEDKATDAMKAVFAKLAD